VPASKRLAAQMKGSARNLWNGKSMTFERQSLSPGAGGETWDPTEPKFGKSRWILDASYLRSPIMSFFIGFLIVVATFAFAWPFLPRRYEATATIILHPTGPESATDSAESLRQTLDESAIQSEIDQISAPTLLSIVVSKLHLADDPEFIGGWKRWFAEGPLTEADLREKLLEHLSVSKGRRSYTVKFDFRSSDPIKSAALSNALLDAYLADQTARKRKAIDNLTALLAEQVNQLRAKSDASQLTVKDFLVRTGLIDKGATTSLEGELSTLSSEAAMARSRTAEAQARAAELTNLQKAGRLDGAPEVLASPVIQTFKTKLAGAKSVVSTVDLPERAIDAQIAIECDRILRSAKTQASVLAEQEVALKRAIEAIRVELVRRKNLEFGLVALQHDAEADRKALDSAVVRLAGQTARANAVVPDVNVMSPPVVPTRPAFPNPLLTVLAAVIAGCLVGVAMVWRPFSDWARRFTNNIMN
jgi:polysaccharide biosynthesis transport protein